MSEARPDRSDSPVDVLLLAALPMELSAAVSALSLRRAGDAFEGEIETLSGRALKLAARTIGIGAAAGQRAREAIAGCRPANGAVLFGFAGGLIDGLKVGDCRGVAEVVAVNEREDEGTNGLEPIAMQNPRSGERGLLAGERGLWEGEGGLLAGEVVRLVTVRGAVVTQAEKKALAAATGAAMVDMETWHVAKAAAELGVSLRVVRAVSDGIDSELPSDIDQWVTASGRPRLLRVMWSMLRNPRNFVRAFALQRGSRLAAKALADALPEVLRRLPVK